LDEINSPSYASASSVATVRRYGLRVRGS